MYTIYGPLLIEVTFKPFFKTIKISVLALSLYPIGCGPYTVDCRPSTNFIYQWFQQT